MSLLALAGLGLAASHAQAQQADFPPVQQVAAVSAPQQSGPSPIEELERRLDQQAQEIQQLQTQLNGGGTQATAAAYISGAGVGTPDCPCGPDGLPMCQPAPAAAPCCTEVTNDKTALKAYWNYGLWFASTNDDFKVHVGGRIQFDPFNTFDVQKSVTNNTGHIGPFEDSSGFRRDRVRMEGTIYDSVDFVWEYDFATAMNPQNFQTVAGTKSQLLNGSSVFTGTGVTDANVTLKYLPYIGNLAVGSYLVPFSFDVLTSDRWMDFIERSAAFDAFVPGTNDANYTLGARAFDWNADKTLTYAASASFNNMWDGASGFDFGNDPMFVGRVTALPYYDASTDGRYLLHVGLDGCAQHCQADPLAVGGPDATQLRSRTALREYLSPLDPSVVSTGVIDGREQYTGGAELVAQYGPLLLQSEIFCSWVTDDNGSGGAGTDTLFFKGGYADLMYMLTGENRNYNRERAVFERIVPYEDYVRMPGEYGRACGWGAWQLGARYSYVDLDSMSVHGGVVNEFTAGLNWFLNPNLKFQFNYDYMFRDNEGVNAPSNGRINSLGTRMCLDF